MTLESLTRCERELQALVAGERASAVAREAARIFNADVSDVRGAILDPVRGMLERGRANPDLDACLEKSVAQLAFWRRILLNVHRGAFESAPTPPDYLVSWLRS
jgi:hypothetical protein